MRNTLNPLKICFLLILITATHNAFGLEGEEDFCKGVSGQDEYAKLYVTAHLRKDGYKSTPNNAIEADVYLNGIKVGKTPYQDCLPKGAYLVEIRVENRTPYQRKIMAVPGESYTVIGEFVIALTIQERVELKKKQIKAAEQRKERERKEKLAKWKADLKKWEVEAAPIQKQRRPYIRNGTIILVSGAGLLIIGGILENAAVNYHQKAEDSHNLWLESDEAQNQLLLDEIEKYQNKRDLYHGIGIPCLALGGVALITAIIIYARMPCLPEQPKKPKGLETPKPKASLKVSPVMAGNLFGGTISFTF